jgi:hypothetical protein
VVGSEVPVVAGEVALQFDHIVRCEHDGYVDPERRHLGDMRAGDAAERAGDDVGPVLEKPRLHAGGRAGVDLVETGGAEGV